MKKPSLFTKQTYIIPCFIVLLSLFIVILHSQNVEGKRKDVHTISTYVNGNSMKPGLKNGEQVCLKERYYTESSDVQWGDIIGIHFNGKDTNVVKRVIGIPHDSIVFSKDGYIYRNDTKLKEPYVYGRHFVAHSSLARTLLQIERNGGKIPENMFLALGDNRAQSIDSTTYGLVDFEQILGKVEKQREGKCL